MVSVAQATWHCRVPVALCLLVNDCRALASRACAARMSGDCQGVWAAWHGPAHSFVGQSVTEELPLTSCPGSQPWGFASLHFCSGATRAVVMSVRRVAPQCVRILSASLRSDAPGLILTAVSLPRCYCSWATRSPSQPGVLTLCSIVMAASRTADK